MKTFTIAGATIRGFLKDGELWLVARDLADLLGICSKNIKRDLQEEHQGSAKVPTQRGLKAMKTINSDGLMSILLRSRHSVDHHTKDWAFNLLSPYLKMRVLETS